ncbi:MAG TPA: metal ABC transporter ATP-binding protein [Opitutales bacterium]|nr:metal ABC transporter ATP-binding protein [Opitutales bacterium]
MSPAAVLCDHVNFSYDGQTVLEGVNFAIQQNQATCLVGPNGGGKTTLLKLILGLLSPDSGRIEILGQKPDQAQRLLGYMPQYLHYDPLFPVSVREVVLMGRQGKRSLFRAYSKEDYAFADQILEELNLSGLIDRQLGSLSGGQRQRVLIARALACEPKILLLDEPTANIDRTVEAELIERLHALSSRVTVVIVSHDLGFVSSWVDQVLCVNHEVTAHPARALSGKDLEATYGHALKHVAHTPFDQHNHGHHSH